MAIRYLSEHDSPDDPGGLIREALNLGEERDPAEAAGRLIADYGLAEAEPEGAACRRLVEMLKETADFPAQRMTRHLCQPRRRGGWRRNRPSTGKP